MVRVLKTNGTAERIMLSKVVVGDQVEFDHGRFEPILIKFAHWDDGT
jgi:hypothetical protein